MKNNMNDDLLTIIQNFETCGQDFVIGKRNKIKTFDYQGNTINIKSFKVPILINGFIYKYFRKSKAKRSYENANYLINNGIGTPKPIAFYEEYNRFFLKKSYYISEHFVPDLIFRDVFNSEYYNNPHSELDVILRGIANFTFNLHEKGIEFIDHSAGNTLIKKDDSNEYKFYLVDLNRMSFHKKMSLKQRIFNMRKLTPSEYMIRIMSNEYAKLYHFDETIFFNLLLNENQKFFKKFDRKKAIKKKFKFWKS